MDNNIQFTQEDVDNLGRKLDEFAAVLTDREHVILRSIISLASEALKAKEQAAGPASRSSRPPLSSLLGELGPSIAGAKRTAASRIALYGITPIDLLRRASTEDLWATLEHAESTLLNQGRLDDKAPSALKAIRAELMARSRR